MSDAYREMNLQLHESNPDYGATGQTNGSAIAALAKRMGCSTILDFGCGKGTLKPAIAQADPSLAVSEYDPAVPGKDTLPSAQFDAVVALDVMEHIEPEYLDSVLDTIRRLSRKCVVLVVATRPATKNLPDGRNAHLIVEQPKWWQGRLRGYFQPMEETIQEEGLVFIGLPKPPAPGT